MIAFVFTIYMNLADVIFWPLTQCMRGAEVTRGWAQSVTEAGVCGTRLTKTQNLVPIGRCMIAFGIEKHKNVADFWNIKMWQILKIEKNGRFGQGCKVNYPQILHKLVQLLK